MSSPIKTELILHQLSSLQQSYESGFSIHCTWFAFLCTVNATALGVLLTERLRFRTRFFPMLFIFGNVLAAVSSYFTWRHYENCFDGIEQILSSHGMDAIQPRMQMAFASLTVGLISVVMAGGWAYVLANWLRYSRGDSQ